MIYTFLLCSTTSNNQINSQLTTNTSLKYVPTTFQASKTLLGDFWNLSISNFNSSSLLNFLQSFQFLSTCSLFFIVIFFLIISIFIGNENIKIISYALIFLSTAAWLFINCWFKKSDINNIIDTINLQQSYNSSFEPDMNQNIKNLQDAISSKCLTLDQLMASPPDITPYLDNYNKQNALYTTLANQVNSINITIQQQNNSQDIDISKMNQNYIKIIDTINLIKNSLNIVDMNGFTDLSINVKLQEINNIYNPENIMYPYFDILSDLTKKSNDLLVQSNSITNTLNAIDTNLQNIRKSIYPMKQLIHNINETCFNFYVRMNSDGKVIFNTNPLFIIDDFLSSNQFYLSDNNKVKSIPYSINKQNSKEWVYYFLVQDYSGYQSEFAVAGYTDTQNNNNNILYIVSLSTAQIFFPTQSYLLINSNSSYNTYDYDSTLSKFNPSVNNLLFVMNKISTLLNTKTTVNNICAIKTYFAGLLGFSTDATETLNQNVYINNIASPTSISLDGILLNLDSNGINKPFIENYIPAFINNKTNNCILSNLKLTFSYKPYWKKSYNSLSNLLSTNNDLYYDVLPKSTLDKFQKINSIVTAQNIASVDTSISLTDILSTINNIASSTITNRRQIQILYNSSNSQIIIKSLLNNQEMSSIMTSTSKTPGSIYEIKLDGQTLQTK